MVTVASAPLVLTNSTEGCTAMAIVTEPVSEMAILSSEKTRQTALALKGAGIISWQMPVDTYGVFDAFKKVSDT